MIGYTSANKGTNIVDAVENGSDQQIILLNDNTKSILCNIDQNGNPIWEKGLSDIESGQQPTNLLVNTDGIYIAMNGYGNPKNNLLYKTDASFNIDCVATPTSIQNSDATSFLKDDDAQMNVQNEINNTVLFSNTSAGQSNYAISTNNICLNTCCQDILDTLHTVTKTICEKDQYQLPNGVPVTTSGTYYIINKTVLGCDSISYYHITILKDPAAISLGSDTCMEGKDSLVLIATPGYDRYSWNNGFTFENSYIVHQPGNYQVTVTNQCGTKTTSIHVLAICDAPIYIPNAFTPNADGLNEVFRIPPTPYYDLNSFKIFNRWGEIIFQTNRIGNGWDGKYKGIQQPSGIFTYTIHITSLKTGKTSMIKGAFQLIR
jgi:gliding motility-associated-like protein